jgi:hypothetical protein
MIFEALFGGIYLLMAAVYLISLGQLRGFLAETRAIGDTRSLERYKDLVRRQMHLALVVIAVLLTGLALGLAMILRHGVTGLVVVLLANALVLVMGLYHKQMETRVRGLPAPSPELEEEYRRVSKTWLKKALPDF